MGMPKDQLLIGSKELPYHLSVGLVAVHDGKIAVIKRNMVGKGEIYLLPKETVSVDETFREAALRGLKEEIGGVGKLISFLGSRSYQFMRGETQIHKTVIYFLVKIDSIGERAPEESEKDDEIIWADFAKAKELLSNTDTHGAFGWEAEILDRV